MNIIINGRSIELRYSFRALMIYEKITEESFNPKGITEIMVFFYSVILASDRDITLSFDDFINFLDSEPTLLNDFSIWLTKTLTKNNTFSDKNENSEEVTELKKN